MLYDTQSVLPLAVLGHLHYDSITDLAWSSDGQYLAVSSRDCYCRWVGRAWMGGGGFREAQEPKAAELVFHCCGFNTVLAKAAALQQAPLVLLRHIYICCALDGVNSCS